MGSKGISQPFQVFTNATMSGQATVTSLVTDVRWRDSVSYQFNWTGTPQGSFAIQGSNDYAPGLPQSAEPPQGQNSGTWNSLTLSTTPVAAGSGSFTYLVNLNQLGFAYVRAQYTNTTSSGVLTGFIMAKSLGG